MDIQETDGQEPEEHGVAIYSKWAILGFSIFFSPLIGGVLLMLNLRSIGYKKEGNILLLFSVAYYFAISFLVTYIAKWLHIPLNNQDFLQNPKIIVSLLALNIIGGGILAEYFFKRHFPYDDYEHKSIWKAFIITIVVLIPLSMLIRL